MNYFRSFKPPSKFAQEFLYFSDGLGHLKSESFFIDRKNFNNYLVMYVLSGKLHVEQNGHYIMQKGEGVIMRLMDYHKYYTDPEDICEILWIHFNGRQCEPFFQHMEQNYSMPAIFREDKVAEIIKKCFAVYNNTDSETEFLISQYIYSMLLTIFHSICHEKEQLAVNPKMEFISKVSAYINNNLYGRISLHDLAEQVNLSTYHFCRVFSKYFGMTPVKFILSKKVEISKYLLSCTNEPLSSIASSLGFSDQSHFSKVFKSFESKSPLHFRKTSR
jgi:AraC-like DNA-binding protein